MQQGVPSFSAAVGYFTVLANRAFVYTRGKAEYPGVSWFGQGVYPAVTDSLYLILMVGMRAVDMFC